MIGWSMVLDSWRHSYALYLSRSQAWRSGNLGDWIDTVDTYAFKIYLIVFIEVLKTIQAPSTHSYPTTPQRYSL